MFQGLVSIGTCVLIHSILVLNALREVSLHLSDLEMDWTSSFLVQSDKQAIALHLLFAPVGYSGEASRERSFYVVKVRCRGRRDAFR